MTNSFHIRQQHSIMHMAENQTDDTFMDLRYFKEINVLLE